MLSYSLISYECVSSPCDCCGGGMSCLVTKNHARPNKYLSETGSPLFNLSIVESSISDSLFPESAVDAMLSCNTIHAVGFDTMNCFIYCMALSADGWYSFSFSVPCSIIYSWGLVGVSLAMLLMYLIAPRYSLRYCLLFLCVFLHSFSNSLSVPVKQPHVIWSSSKQYVVIRFDEPIHPIWI